MRKAYIGLSSPTAYFYDHDRKYFNEPWQWNPILESPQGLITLFDELWFLTRSLCPVSLRNENYVKFLDEDSNFVPLIKGVATILHTNQIDGLISEYPYLTELIDVASNFPNQQFKRYNEVIEYIYGRKPGAGFPIDNHSKTIKLCGLGLIGDSMRIDLLAFDVVILSCLGVRNIELITNSFNNSVLKFRTSTLQNIEVSQKIIIKRIPVLQTPSGPIIEGIERIRENSFLIDFRNKILQNNNPEDFIELVTAVEQEFSKYRNEVLLEKQKGSRLITSLANNALSFFAGSVIPVPGIGEIKSLMSDSKTRKFNWTGFISEIENSA